MNTYFIADLHLPCFNRHYYGAYHFYGHGEDKENG